MADHETRRVYGNSRNDYGEVTRFQRQREWSAHGIDRAS
jgi:hypothetical protein